jgi:TPR repeat protein
MYALAVIYQFGKGLPETIENPREESLKYFRQAAQAGNADAQFELGMKYQKGKELRPDPVRARDLFERAAHQGNRNAMDYLARMYRDGQGIAPNPQEAARWFRLAAEKGDADSQFALGELYMKGFGAGLHLVDPCGGQCVAEWQVDL